MIRFIKIDQKNQPLDLGSHKFKATRGMHNTDFFFNHFLIIFLSKTELVIYQESKNVPLLQVLHAGHYLFS